MQNNLWSDFPITYFTHKKINHINWYKEKGTIFLYFDGKCVFKITEPKNAIGSRASIGIYDNTILESELEDYIEGRCEEVVKYAK